MSLKTKNKFQKTLFKQTTNFRIIIINYLDKHARIKSKYLKLDHSNFYQDIRNREIFMLLY